VRDRRHALFAAVLVVCMGEAAAYLAGSITFAPESTGALVLEHAVSPLMEAVAIVLLVAAGMKASPPVRRFCRWMAVAAALTLAGDAGRGVLDILGAAHDRGSAIDLFDVAAALAMTAAVYAKFGSPLRYWRPLLDSSILALVVGYVTITVVVQPQLAHSLTGVEVLAAARSVAMLVAGLAAASALATSDVRPEPGAALVVLAIPVQALTSLLYAAAATTGPVLDGNPIYAGFQLGWGLMIAGAAALLIWRRRPRRIVLPRVPLITMTTTYGLIALLAAVMWHSRVLEADPLGVAVAWLGILTVLARLHLTIRERGTMAAEMRILAETDSLTGLPNRRRFDERLDETVAAHAGGGPDVAILVIDVDGFKRVNDGYGHPVGDEVLVELAHRIRGSLRPADILARVGGEEFVALLVGVDGGELFDVAERCRHEVAREPVRAEGFDIPVTISVGGAALPDHAATVEELVRVADRGLYEAKQAGRNRVHVGLASTPQRQIPIPELGVIGNLEALADRLDGAQALQEHSMAMVDVAERLCGALGVSTAQRRRCLGAARLHDVGKVGTPAHILGKPGPLTAAEQVIMQDHVRVGVEILRSFATTREFAAIVAEHHERFDGSGYPAGLAGSQISVEARIIAVADAWTAMLADRPYRPALPAAAARAELLRCAGSHFDPSIVAAFMELLDTGGLGEPSARALAA
jgi:diguanylate cyclase (GGDEF)-like protein/putative nucleotidyltransferase with HDIG domain